MTRAQAVVVATLAAALVALVVLAFWPAFSAEFLNFDDDVLFTSNHAWRGLGRAQLEWMWRTNTMGHFIPLTWMSFGLDYALHGLSAPTFAEAPWYHATNVALHALAALAVFALGARVFELARPGIAPRVKWWSAAFAAGLWAAHPMRVESVVWLTERRDVLSGLFFVLALLAWLAWAEPRRAVERSNASSIAIALLSAAAAGAALYAIELPQAAGLALRSPAALVVATCAWIASIALASRHAERKCARWFPLVCLCLLLALLSKASAIVFPGLLVVLDVWPLRRVTRESIVSLVVEKLPLAAIAVVGGRIALWAQANGLTAPLHTHSAGERIAQASFGLFHYPAKAFVPLGLLPMYEVPRAISLAEPRWFVPALLVLAITAAAFALRKRAPALLGAWCAFGVVIAPVLGLVQSGPQLVADRYSYLACIPFELLVAGAVARLAESRREVAIVLAIACVAGSTWLTRRQADVWRTSTSLWEHAYALAPDNATNLSSVGTLRSLASEREDDPQRALALLREAQSMFERAFEIDDDPKFLRSRSQVRARMAEVDAAHAEEHTREALELSRRALELAEARHVLLPEYKLDYGTDLLNAGRVDEALEQLRAFVELRPQNLRGLINYAGALTLSGRANEALEVLERACRLEPNDPRPWDEIAMAHDELGDAHAASLARNRAQQLRGRP